MGYIGLQVNAERTAGADAAACSDRVAALGYIGLQVNTERAA